MWREEGNTNFYFTNQKMQFLIDKKGLHHQDLKYKYNNKKKEHHLTRENNRNLIHHKSNKV